MQRMTAPHAEQGGVAVLLAILVLPLLGFAAISVDVGALYAERRQLQNGADAAALAIAQDCAGGDCGAAATTAVTFAGANANDGFADAAATFAQDQVTVRASTRRPDGSTALAHWFAPVFGVDATTVTAQGSAAWGVPTGGTAGLPIIFSWCAFTDATGGEPSTENEVVIRYDNMSVTGCTGPSGKEIPGGFGWLETDAGVCRATHAVGQQVVSDPGNSVPSICSPAYVAELLSQPVLLPVFEESGEQGTSGWYRVYGYAAFQITGYRFSGNNEFNAGGACSGNHRCIKGYFLEFVYLDDDFQFGGDAPDLGASLVGLTG
jgi:Flp pilus assembly protein TadG